MFTLLRVCRFAAALALLVATAAAQPTAASWDSVKALTTGTDVRILAGPRTVRGKVYRITDDTLAVTSGKGQEMFTQQDVSRVSVKKPGHRKRNALIGLGIGAGVGLGIGLSASSCTGLGCIGADAVEIGAPLALAVVGTAIGAVIPTGGWREIYKK